jgi:SAM-dependent methyltransferase
MNTQPFDDLTEVYEAMIDWPKRLANEEPFYRFCFDQTAVRSVLDVACGTAHHAAMFASWGLQVEGRDRSPEMIDRCANRYGSDPNLRFSLHSFQDPPPDDRVFDASLCVGNSLALADDLQQAEQTIRHMLASVRDGGLVIVHVLNLSHLPDGPCVWQKFLRRSIRDQDVVVLKGVHRNGDQGFVDLAVVPIEAPSRARTESIRFLGLDGSRLSQWAVKGGADSVQLYGDYRRQPYSQQQSPDLIMVARKSISPR